MINTTIFLINGNSKDLDDGFEYKKFKASTFIQDLYEANGKYIIFIKNLEDLRVDYFDRIKELTNKEFDCASINYTIEIDGKKYSTEEIEEPEIFRKPCIGDYIFGYIFRKSKLFELIISEDKSCEKIDQIFQVVEYIAEPIYNHKPGKKMIDNFIFVDEKEIIERKNVFYMGEYCNGQFNGYITWLNNIGRCYGKKYDITILYDKIYGPTKEVFQKHFEVIQREENKLYLIDRLFVTYSTYYYSKNILTKEENYMFIHGLMKDYDNARAYTKDNYTKYIGVSKTCADKAKGFFPTNDIEYILNPIKIDKSLVKPHLKLVSALRNDPIKRLDRIHRISEILDEEEIPYTWNVFVDTRPFEEAIYGGVSYRYSIQNPLPYINDADYFVQLSDSEACSYSVMEALALNTKVILTPIESYYEMNIDETQGFIIPFEMFEPENKEELRKIVLKIYEDKNKSIKNKLTPDLWKKYEELLKK